MEIHSLMETETKVRNRWLIRKGVQSNVSRALELQWVIPLKLLYTPHSLLYNSKQTLNSL